MTEKLGIAVAEKLLTVFYLFAGFIEYVWLIIRSLPVFDNKYTRRFNDWANEKENAYNRRKNAEVIALYESIRRNNDNN